MNGLQLLGVLLCVGVGIYLVVALLYPEKFQ